MSSTVTASERLEVLFGELAELAGQRNAIDARIVAIAAEMERDELCGATGARSVKALVEWKLGASSAHARTICAVAGRLEEFPRCVAGMREGRLSLDQVGVIAAGAAAGSDEHYAQLAAVATVTQLRTAVRLEPRPEPEEPAAVQRSVTKSSTADSTSWRITLPHDEAAIVDAALQSHLDALIGEWKTDHSGADMPDTADAFLHLVQAGWDVEVATRPHGQRTTVVVHVDLDKRIGALHLGPLLSDADRQYLSCDATCEVWFQRQGRVIGAGRATRTVNRRLRRVLEHRHRSCAVPGCEATRGLHAHHLTHWEDGGPTELTNLILLCPYHHRLHHRGGITISGTAEDLTVTDSTGEPLTAGSLARPPTETPPDVAPYPGPTGERANWWWYNPYDPHKPSTN